MSKYGNEITKYKGVKYASKKEANYAAKLDMLMKSTDERFRVVKWDRQVLFHLTIKGELITKYVLDFIVTFADGRIEHIDVKGRKKGLPYEMFKMKKRLMMTLYNIDVLEK